MLEDPKEPTHLFAERPPLDAIERLFDLSVDLLGVASVFGYLTLLSPSWERVLGWSNEELMSQPYVEFVHFDDVPATIEAARQLALPGAAPLVGFENRYRTSNGTFRTFEWNVVAENHSLYFVAHDTTRRKETEFERMRAEASLRAVIDSVDEGIYVADSRDRVTLVNPAGLRILGYQSETELFGRDPHAMFHHSHADGADIPAANSALRKVRTQGRPVHVNLDSFLRRDGSVVPVSYTATPVELGDGTGSVVTFREMTNNQAEVERKEAVHDDVEWLVKIRDSLAEDRFALYAQPVIDLTNLTTIKHELLLRMLLPSGEVVAAHQFLPVAQKYGLMLPIDKWVITKGAEFAAQGKRVAVNLSLESIIEGDILSHIESELVRTEAQPGNLIFELAETALTKDVNACRKFADRLVSHGCVFALDDFGTGNASLSYLRELPITYVKIDGRFAGGITREDEDPGIAEAIVLMAQSLGRITIAEGIEDEGTLEWMRNMGVDLGQGYFIGLPRMDSRLETQ